MSRDAELRARIVAEARGWIGTPYRHRASCRGVGVDCLGLVRGVWRAAIGPEPESLPAYAADWAEATRAERLAQAGHRHLVPVALAAIRPGDVLLFRWRAHLPAKHAAILVEAGGTIGGMEHGRMVHAHDGTAVAEVHLTPWWRRRMAYAFAFPGTVP